MIRNFVAWVIFFVLLAYLCGLISAAPLNELAYTRVLAPLTVLEDQAARRALQQQFDTPFPASASGFYRANRGDEAYWIRVSVSPQELPELFRGSEFITCRFPWQDRYRPVFEFSRELSEAEEVDLSWWSPSDATISAYVGGECTGTDYRIFRAFVDQTDRSQWTMYMEIIRL